MYTISINESQIHHTKWTKPYSRDNGLHDCIYDILAMENLEEIKWNSSCKKIDMWERINNRWQVLLRIDESVLKLDYSASYMAVYICQSSSKDSLKEQLFFFLFKCIAFINSLEMYTYYGGFPLLPITPLRSILHLSVTPNFMSSFFF